MAYLDKSIQLKEREKAIPLVVGFYTTKGRKERQEDSLGGVQKGGLVALVIADGVSTEDDGRHHGKKASQKAVDEFKSQVKSENYIVPVKYVDWEDVYSAMEEKATSQSGGGATTVSCALIEGREVDYSNLGDSPIVDIDLTTGACVLLSYSQKGKKAHSLKEYQYLGVGTHPKVHHGHTTLRENHALLMFTDGANKAFNTDLDYQAPGEPFFEPEIARIVAENDPDQACLAITGLSLANRSGDNISIFVVK